MKVVLVLIVAVKVFAYMMWICNLPQMKKKNQISSDFFLTYSTVIFKSRCTCTVRTEQLLYKFCCTRDGS